ncbi:MAG: peptidoglycan LD-endopeptidase LytH [Actinomycetota bacterium]|nr:peptidoglycan LD-endopeptidase LytH [Actinomycetota bacterium]
MGPVDRQGLSSIVVAVAVIGLSLGAYLVLHDDPETAPVATTEPTLEPSEEPTDVPSEEPSATPSAEPSESPTEETGSRYEFPVQPLTAANFGPGHEAFPATDIYAAVGTNFVAVTSGVVNEVQKEDLWFPGNNDPNQRNGIYIAYIGDDGVRYFGSHLSSIAPGIHRGGRVEVGQLLGHVGRTGKETPGPSYVHFGISHPTQPGDWEVRRGEFDPYRYLKAWAAGRDLIPKLR